MSNEYKEWEKDRTEEAWNALHEIIEIVEGEVYEDCLDSCQTDESYKYNCIESVLELYGWI